LRRPRSFDGYPVRAWSAPEISADAAGGLQVVRAAACHDATQNWNRQSSHRLRRLWFPGCTGRGGRERASCGYAGRAHFIAADLADARSAGELAVEATRILDGRIDILVNNAGIGIGGPTDAMTEADFDRIYAVNVKAPYFLTAAIAPAMAGRGEGVIVNLGSKTALLGTSASSLYGSSKAALELLTRCWAAEFGPRGVRVNTVSPGPTLTAMTAANPKNVELQVAHAPARRAGHPTEIAAAVAFLASDDAKYIHGARIPLDGGRTAV